jgi:Cu-Zn family superoxide dismutase
MRQLPDGRVGALVHVNRTDDARPEERAFVTFVQRDGRWLVDETVNEGPADETVIARATLQDTAGTTMGTAEFTQSFGGLVTVAVTLDGAPPGGHALHLHAVGACDPEGDAPFASAGDHFNPAGAAHPEHAGDLGNMGTDTAGHGEFWTVADRFTLSPSPSSLLDGDGSALILTAGMDDQTSAPDGNSGPRIACGVLSLVDRDAPTDAGGLNLTMLALGGLIIGSGSLLALQGWRTRRRTRSRPQPVGVAQRPPSTQE